MKQIICDFNGSYMLINKSVADELGLKEGYKIKDDNEFLDILSRNCQTSIAEMVTEMAIERASKA